MRLIIGFFILFNISFALAQETQTAQKQQSKRIITISNSSSSDFKIKRAEKLAELGLGEGTPEEYLAFLEKNKNNPEILKQVMDDNTGLLQAVPYEDINLALEIALKEFEIRNGDNFSSPGIRKNPDVFFYLHQKEIFANTENLGKIHETFRKVKIPQSEIDKFHCAPLVSAMNAASTINQITDINEKTLVHYNYAQDDINLYKKKLAAFFDKANQLDFNLDTKCSFYADGNKIEMKAEDILIDLVKKGTFTEEELATFKKSIRGEINPTHLEKTVTFCNGDLDTLVDLDVKGICNISAAVKMITDNTRELDDQTKALNVLKASTNSHNCTISSMTTNFKLAQINAETKKHVQFVVKHEIEPGSYKYIEIMFTDIDLDELQKELQQRK